ncbi:MAG TPA: hypothetical protein VN805_06895 [Caulobacteraceae bacterium]|nr:hypothetical protein [Caulobacteraceae bacterium]
MKTALAVLVGSLGVLAVPVAAYSDEPLTPDWQPVQECYERNAIDYGRTTCQSPSGFEQLIFGSCDQEEDAYVSGLMQSTMPDDYLAARAELQRRRDDAVLGLVEAARHEQETVRKCR